MANGHGGKRPGAGRKPKPALKKTRAVADAIVLKGDTPLEILYDNMRYYRDQGMRKEAVAIAEKLAPYCHPRLAAVMVNTVEAQRRLRLVEEIVDVLGHRPEADQTAPQAG